MSADVEAAVAGALGSKEAKKSLRFLDLLAGEEATGSGLSRFSTLAGDAGLLGFLLSRLSLQVMTSCRLAA